jgi:sulfatase maturation enzyme AslB (radical SAM superfamily)
LSTNGSLLTEEMLSVLNEFRFKLLLSFDGYAQNTTRKENSFPQIVETIEAIQSYPDIELRTQSVFIPQTVHLLSDSIAFIVRKGIRSADFNLDYSRPWHKEDLTIFSREVHKLRELIIDTYKTTEHIPIPLYNRSDVCGVAACEGGRENMVLAPDKTLWGCFLLFDYARFMEDDSLCQTYSFGSIDEFVKKHEEIYPKILHRYSRIRLDNCRTDEIPCIRCLDLLRCTICPVAAAFGSRRIGRIPGWVCEIRRIFSKERRAFWNSIDPDHT